MLGNLCLAPMSPRLAVAKFDAAYFLVIAEKRHGITFATRVEK